MHTTSGMAVDVDAYPKKLDGNHPYKNDAEPALGGTLRLPHDERPEKYYLGSYGQNKGLLSINNTNSFVASPSLAGAGASTCDPDDTGRRGAPSTRPP